MAADNLVYVIISLGGAGLETDWEDCLVATCTNKTVLSELTGISRDRLAYVFIRKRRSALKEKGFLIYKVTSIYKGRQKGVNKGVMTGFNRRGGQITH